MKRIKLFEQFVKYVLNEAEDALEDTIEETDEEETTDETTDDTPAEEETKSKEYLPKLSSVVEKKFFRELKQHIIYWLTYDSLSFDYMLESADEETRAVVGWFTDRTKDGVDPQYSFKVKYAEVDTVGDIEKVEEVLLIIKIYDFVDTSNLLKETEMKITLENINSDFLKKTLKSMKKRILVAPNNQDDIDTFKQREERRLGDNSY